MKKQSQNAWYGKLEVMTRKRGFFLILLAIQFIPPFSTSNWTLGAWMDLDRISASHALIYEPEAVRLYPLFKAGALIAVLGLLLFRNRFAALFSFYAGLTYLLFFAIQLVGFGHEEYGMVFNTPGFLMFAGVAGAWFQEARVGVSDYGRAHPGWARYWVVPLAVFAFWLPESQGGPDFSLSLFFTSAGGMAMCMMTPVYLAILTLFFPRVNLVTFRITALVGLLIGLYQMIFTFGMNFRGAWWGGVMHLPLVILSTYSLFLAYNLKNRNSHANIGTDPRPCSGPGRHSEGGDSGGPNL